MAPAKKGQAPSARCGGSRRLRALPRKRCSPGTRGTGFPALGPGPSSRTPQRGWCFRAAPARPTWLLQLNGPALRQVSLGLGFSHLVVMGGHMPKGNSSKAACASHVQALLLAM